MRLTLVVAAVVLLAPPAAAQHRPGPTDLIATYDRIEGRTRVVGNLPFTLGSRAQPSIALQVVAWHADSTLSTPLDTLLLSAYTTGGRANWEFLWNSDVTLLVNGTDRMRFSSSAGGVPGSEYTFAKLALADVERLAAARTIEGRVGNWEFEFSSDHLEVLRRMVLFAKRDPAAPTPVPWPPQRVRPPR